MKHIKTIFLKSLESSRSKDMVCPHYIHVLCKFLEIIGYLNEFRFKRNWLNLLKKIYFIWFHCIHTTALISQLISTCTRSIRYVPEFLSRLLESFALYLFYLECLFILFQFKQLQGLMKFIENSFSTADECVLKRCNQRARKMVTTFLILSAVGLSGSFLETYFPLSQKEMDLVRYVYKRKYPERRFQTNFWIPFVDDSEFWCYEIIIHFELYWTITTWLMALTSVCYIPMFANYIEGQYIILRKYIEKIGHIHRDKKGHRIFYTNIIKKKVMYVGADNELRHRFKFKSMQEIEDIYQQNYCRQIIQFHQMIIRFQEQAS